jgi:hypothetical protein
MRGKGALAGTRLNLKQHHDLKNPKSCLATTITEPTFHIAHRTKNALSKASALLLRAAFLYM